jgi:hypothetical protein
MNGYRLQPERLSLRWLLASRPSPKYVAESIGYGQTQIALAVACSLSL